MIQITVANIRSEEWNPPEAIMHCCIYLVRDGSGKILYIGRSSSIIDRLQSHLGLDWRENPSRLGRHILSTEGSEDWPIELYSLEDGKPFLDQYRSKLPPNLQSFFQQYSGFDDSMVEQAMIRLLNPVFNVHR